VVLSTHKHDKSTVHLLRIDQMHISRVGFWEAQGEVTCISIFTVSETTWVVMGVVVNASPCVLIYSLDGSLLIAKTLDGLHGKKYPFAIVTHGKLTAIRLPRN
jgi:hypothetical protein